MDHITDWERIVMLLWMDGGERQIDRERRRVSAWDPALVLGHPARCVVRCRNELD